MNGFSRMARRVRGSHGCRYGLVALGLLLCWGCASASSGSGFSERQQDQRNIQLTIRNENATPITVFVWWQGGRRVRLGDLSGVSTRTFTTAARDGGIWFEVEDQTTFTRGRRRRPDNYVPVGPGDHLEVITGRGGFILSVRRVPSL